MLKNIDKQDFLCYNKFAKLTEYIRINISFFIAWVYLYSFLCILLFEFSLKTQIPLSRMYRNVLILCKVSLATIGVCVFYASAPAGAFFNFTEEKKMKKRILSFITMLTLSSNFFTISAYANSTWKDSYMNFLLNKTFQECEGIPTISFADMDFDGVPELLYYDGGMLFGMGQRYSDVYSINSLGVVYKKGTVFSGATSASQAFLDKNTNQKKRLNFRGTSQVIYLSEMTCEYDSTAIFSISEAFICDDNMYHWFENGKEVYKSSKYPTYEDVEMLLNDYKIIDDRTPEEQWKNFYSQSQKREIVDRMLSEFKSNSINVILNGTELTFDQPPILDPAGRVLVPIRKIAEAMGDDVKWNQDLQTAFVQHKERALIIPLYKDHLYTAYSDNPIEWRKYTLDVPSQVQNERTLTPVRAFCESLGATVNWDDSTQTVYIEYNGNYAGMQR